MEPWRPATHYATLGVGRDATDDQLKKQYKLLAKHHHPDRNRGDEAAAAERFKAVHEAYTTLSDAAARREYDAELRQKMAQQVAARRPPPRAAPAAAPPWRWEPPPRSPPTRTPPTPPTSTARREADWALREAIAGRNLQALMKALHRHREAASADVAAAAVRMQHELADELQAKREEAHRRREERAAGRGGGGGAV
jgi:curved DNA-binding protein CbpA